VPSHLMDRRLFGFEGLRASGRPDADGDIAFDDDPCSTGESRSGEQTISFVQFDDD
jgi:tRNA 2-thiocytidine biosynthesis protein TtcA